MYKNSGFTLIEMMVTVAIMGVALTVAVPSFATMIKGNKQVTHTNDLLGALNFARSEAIKRGQRVVVCRSVNNVCQRDWPQSWEQGWMIFVDPDNDAILTTGDTTLRIHGPLDGGDTMAAVINEAVNDGSFYNFISYSSDGAVHALNGTPISGDLSFGLCYAAQKNKITINLVGRGGVSKDPC